MLHDARRAARRGKIAKVNLKFCCFILAFYLVNHGAGTRADTKNAFWPREDTKGILDIFLHFFEENK